METAHNKAGKGLCKFRIMYNRTENVLDVYKRQDQYGDQSAAGKGQQAYSTAEDHHTGKGAESELAQSVHSGVQFAWRHGAVCFL